MALSTFRIALALCLVSTSATGALKQQHTEDFTTNQFKDTLNTTALWDTVAGELKLFPHNLTPLGSFDTTGDAGDVAVSGDFAYVADLGSGLQVIDISDPTLPTLAGSFATAGVANAVAVDGDFAFVASDAAGLEILSVTTPATPSLVGTFNTLGTAVDVAVSGDLAFVADGDSGLVIINIQNTAAPALLGRFAVPGFAWGVVVEGNLAFVSALDSGLVIVDFTTPASPTLAGRFLTTAFDVAVGANIAYIVDNLAGILTVDITNVASPSVLGGFATPGAPFDIELDGTFAHVASGSGGLLLLDISNPALPTLIDSVTTPGTSRGVALAGTITYVAEGLSGLRAVENGTAATSEIFTDFLLPNHETPVVSGNILYAAIAFGGIRQVDIYDITSPQQPLLLATFTDPVNLTGDVLAVEGRLLFIGLGSGFGVLDVSDPSTPVVLTPAPIVTAATITEAAVAGDHLYVGLNDATIAIFNIQNPASPTLVTTFSLFPNGVAGLDVEGNILFVGNGNAGLRMINIANPAAPSILGTHNTPGVSRGVAVDGNVAYVADQFSVEIIDVSNPSLPVLLASVPTFVSFDVAVTGNHLLVPDQDGVRTYDVTDPSNPVLLVAHGNQIAGDIAIAGDFAFALTTFSPRGIHVVKAFDRRFIVDLDRAQSTIIDESPENVVRARVTPTQSDSIQWQVSATAGANTFQTLTPGVWTLIDTTGNDLVWRAILSTATPGSVPLASQVDFEWRYAFPLVTAVTDVAVDEGRRVRLTWNNSGHDFVGGSPGITQYAVFRRIDALTAAPGRPAGGRTGGGTTDDGGLASAAVAIPGWDFVTTVPAFTDGSYSVIVPTLQDSSIASGLHNTVFFVRALTSTPGTHFDSPPDSGFSVDNIAPAAPTGLALATGTLSWDEAPEPDFDFFAVYGSDSTTFGATAVLIGFTVSPAIDVTAQPYSNFFVTATDFNGNEGNASGLTTATAVPDVPQIRSLAIRVHPNPFNPVATITYDVPAAGPVTIAVYDVQGRLVEKLLDNEFHVRGVFTLPYRARGATGVLFARIDAGGEMRTVKLVLLK